MCGLTWDWASIPDADGRPVWARLVPGARRVDLNERHQGELLGNQGLDRFTRAHEIGHWDLHAVHPVPEQAPLFALEPVTHENVFCRGRDDDSWQEKQADWFAAALLMPADLFRAAAQGLDLTTQDGMVAMKRTCDVSWSALSVRLKTLGVSHRERDGAIYKP